MTLDDDVFDNSASQWSNDYDAQMPQDVPNPLLWRILVAPRRPRRKTDSGILIADAARHNEQLVQHVGQVVAMGELAFKSDVFKDMQNIPKVGDWVVYGRYAGQPMIYKDYRFLIVNDKELLMTVSNPEDLRVYL